MADIRIAAGKFKLTSKCGEGAFGDIYTGININTNEEVAVKMEYQKTDYP